VPNGSFGKSPTYGELDLPRPSSKGEKGNPPVGGGKKKRKKTIFRESAKGSSSVAIAKKRSEQETARLTPGPTGAQQREKEGNSLVFIRKEGEGERGGHGGRKRESRWLRGKEGHLPVTTLISQAGRGNQRGPRPSMPSPS